MAKQRQPPEPPMTLGNMRAEPDLQEHQRLIIRALARAAAARHLGSRAARNADWQSVLFGIGAAVLFSAAGAALFLADLVFLR